MKRRAALTLLLLFVLGALAACAERSQPSTDGQSAQRRPAASTPLRIAALSPAIGLIVADLGLENRIVARHGFDAFLPRSIPVGGDQSGLDYERLLNAEPTHIVLEWGARPLPETLSRLAEEKGWIVESLTLLALDDVRSATRRIADLVAPWEAEAPDRTRRLLREFDAALAPQPDVARALGRTLILYFTDPIGAAGPDAAIAQVVASLGAELALPDSAPYVSLDAEDVIALDPDTILLLAPGADAAQAQREPARLLGALADLDLRAAKAGRVGVVAHPTSRSASTRLREVAREIADIARGFANPAQSESSAGSASAGSAG